MLQPPEIFPPEDLCVMLSESEERRGAHLLREAADVLELATYSGEETALARLLAAIGHQLYLEPTSDARCLLTYAICRPLQEDHALDE